MQSLRHALRLCGLGTALLPLLAGCGGGGGGGNGNTGGGTTGTTGTTGNNNGGNPTLSVSALTATKGLTATLSESQSTVGVGGTVTYTLTLTNPITGTTQTLNVPSVTAPSAVLIVSDSSGNKVYNPIPAPPFIIVALAPGQSLTETVPVQVFAPAGTYSATATFSFPADSPPPPVTSVGPLTVTAQ